MALTEQDTKISQNTIDAATDAIGAFSREAIERLSHEQNEPAWMLAKRLRAWTLYCEMPGQVGNSTLPISRRLDLRDVRLEDISELPRQNSVDTSVDKGKDGQQEGVIYLPLSEALQKNTALIERYFMTECVQVNDSKFAALHAAFWSEGIFLYVSKNVKMSIPIENPLSMDPANGASFPHTLIIADEGASVTFIDSSWSETVKKPAFMNSVVEIIAGPGATVNYISSQLLGENVDYFTFKKAVGKKDSTVNWYEIALGGRISQSSIQLIMDEEGAAGEMFGIYFPGNGQQMEYDTLQVHAAPRTKSNLLYKGALQGNAKTIFNGIIQVHKGAQRTDAYQANKNILLSSDAHADSIPTLEIEANDVRCTHGVTVGPIDEEVLYYLMSRGLSREEATRMLVVGFLVPVIDKIPVLKTRDKIREYIESRIG